MPSAREINRRIKSVTNTQQITKAMKMVSSVRLRRAQDRAVATAPVIPKNGTGKGRCLQRLSAASPDAGNALFTPHDAVKKTCYIIIGSDKGLAGAFQFQCQQGHGVGPQGQAPRCIDAPGRRPQAH